MSVAKSVVVLILSVGFATAVPRAQDQTQSKVRSSQAPATPSTPVAVKAADVASPEAILAANYDVISGPVGQRDWDRFRSLYLPDARLGSVRHANDGAGLTTHSFTLEEFIAFGDSYFKKDGFFEKEIARHADRYSNIMQVFSTYESRHDAKDPKPFARGINSFQLFFDGNRWWIASVFWQGESPDAPIPEEFLPKRAPDSSSR
jgi:hypothetical protein